MFAQPTRTVLKHSDDHYQPNNAIGECLDWRKFCKATGLRWSGLLKFEEIGYLKPIYVEKGDRYYSWEQLAFIKRMQSFLDGKTCLKDAYQKALEHFAQ